jgi:hypothetical protein
VPPPIATSLKPVSMVRLFTIISSAMAHALRKYTRNPKEHVGD